MGGGGGGGVGVLLRSRLMDVIYSVEICHKFKGTVSNFVPTCVCVCACVGACTGPQNSRVNVIISHCVLLVDCYYCTF